MKSLNHANQGSEKALAIAVETPEWSPHFYQWGRNEELERIARAAGNAISFLPDRHLFTE